MSQLQERLQAALGSAYRVERELGGGGMSRVFVAEEQELGRRVVIKVLPPEVAAGVSLDRFRREIHLAASLQHPHIVPLLTAGHAQELLYYTMPLIEGESLRAKLAREGALPIGDAVKILRDVVDALAYAHQHGVAHRDIKPDNVLLSGHHAVVTDFGVAKAVSESTGQSSLTSAGIALGTPAYMAPEQAAADPRTDHRCDLYAAGALGYEMLTGRPPFTGSTPQQVLAAQVSEAPLPVTKQRATVPTALAELVMRCLEKNPADRFQSAVEVLHLLEAMATPSGGTQPVPTVRALPARRIMRMAAPLAMAALLAIGAVVWWEQNRGAAAVEADPDVVAVLPFRVTGADPSLGYLREGMIDLMAAELTGEGGPRAAHPRTVLSAWRRAAPAADADLPEDAALRLAYRLGAGQLLLGSIVGTPTRLILNASLVEVSSGAARVQVRVEGAPDSLPALAGQLAVQLLARAAGASGPHVATLASTSLPALRAYLAGRAAYRRGRYGDALDRFEEALRFDSTFALAALDLQDAALWVSGFEQRRRALALAWAERDRLSERDRVLLTAYAGPHYPAPSSWADVTTAWERAVQLTPDRPESWWMLGDQPLFHQGRQHGMSDWRERAAAVFRRAVELDSAFVGPLEHLAELAILAGDSTQVRRLGALYLARDSAGEIADFVRWRVAVALGDDAARDALRARFEEMNVQSLGRIIGTAQLDGIALEDGERAAQVLTRRAVRPDMPVEMVLVLHDFALNRGRPAAALALHTRSPRFRSRHWRVWDALYGDGDTSAAAGVVASLAGHADMPLAPRQSARALQYEDICAVEHWRLVHGELGSAASAIARLRSASAPRDAAFIAARSALCAAILEALLASAARRSDAAVVLDRLDSLMQTGPLGGPGEGEAGEGGLVGNLVVARLREAQHDLRRALAAVRRRPYHWVGVLYLSTSLREEGRLAGLTGDRDGAIRAYQHYLALRLDPEPALTPEVERVRGELDKLVGERR